MTITQHIKIALTFDDAPSINETNILYSPERMDIILNILQKHNIKYCTAFVIGKNAIGHEDKLERWLDAGYTLANHTFLHEKCSVLTELEFKKTLLDCHQVLDSVGAFSKSTDMWFRFPYMNYGKDTTQRLLFQSILHDIGYKIAHASISFYDDQYELPLEKAIQSGSDDDKKRVGERFLASSLRNINFMKSMYQKQYDTDIKYIAYSHFGSVSELLLDQMLNKMSGQNINWCDLADASKCSIYTEFETNKDSNGLVLELMKIDSLSLKIKRKLSHISKKWAFFNQNKYGPIWPYLQ